MKKQLFMLITLLTVLNISTLGGECSFQSPGVEIGDSVYENLGLAEIAAVQFSREDNLYIAGENKHHSLDKRVRKTASSPKYLDAVGRLEIKYSNGSTFNCTASLSDTVPGRASRTLTTNRHCIVHRVTGEKPQSIKWTTKLQDGSTITKYVKIENENEEFDVALLSFDTPIAFSKIKPLLLEAQLVLGPKEMSLYSNNIVAAGYSSDKELGDNGKTLTYSEGINGRTFAEDSRNSTVVETFTFGGASGGPLISDADLSEEDIENPYDQKYLLGTLYGGSTVSTVNFRSSNNVEGSESSLYMNYSNFFRNDGLSLFDDLNQ